MAGNDRWGVFQLKRVQEIKRWAQTACVLIALLLITVNVRADITIPSVQNEIFFQTTGPLGDLGIGDYIANQNGDARTHIAQVGIPCVPNTVYRIDLFDPEVYFTAGQTVDDEVRSFNVTEDQTNATADQTNFRMYAPNGQLLNAAGQMVGAADPTSLTIYPPSPATHDAWVNFRTITVSANPVFGVDCGVYNVESWTGSGSATTTGQLQIATFVGGESLNNDENAWRYRIRGGDGSVQPESFPAENGPDGRPGTGDEVWLGLQRMSYQNNTTAAQEFFWFVNDGSVNSPSAWVGRNFDVDINVFCNNNCAINYIAPDNTVYPATLSDTREWNTSAPGAGRGTGDVFDGQQVLPGIWRGDVQISPTNQYVFEIENGGKPTFMQRPDVPELILDKTVSSATVSSPGVLTYTLRIENIGSGAALPLAGNAPEIQDTLPAGTSFSACRVLPPLTGICTGAGSQVSAQLTGQTNPLSTNGQPSAPIAAMLPSANSGYQNFGLIEVDVRINVGVAVNTCFVNNASLDWTDIFANNYRPVQDSVQACVDRQTQPPPPPPNPPNNNGNNNNNPPPSGDPNGGTTSSTGTVTVDGLTLTKTVDQPFAGSGAAVTWRIAVSNATAQTISNLRVVDTLPAELTLLAATTSSPTSSVTWTEREVTLTISSLATGEQVTMTLQTSIRPSVLAPFQITNQACLVSPTNLCASAAVLSVTQLPATGSGTGWHGALLAGLLGMLAMGGVLRFRRGCRDRRSTNAAHPQPTAPPGSACDRRRRVRRGHP